MHQDRVLELVELIYDAASEPSGWARVLTEMVSLTSGTGADLAAFDLNTRLASISQGVGSMSEDFKRDYVQVTQIDPFVIRAKEQGLLRAGIIGLGEQLVPLRELERTEFYCSFGRRHDYIGGVAAIIAADKRSVAAIGISRSRSREFGTPEVRLLRTLMPHLQRAWHLHLQIAEGDNQRSSLAEALNHLAAAVFIVALGPRVVFANESARLLLGKQDGLTLDRGVLRGAAPQDTAALNALIAGSLSTAASEGLASGGGLQLRRPSGGRPLRLVVSPLPRAEKFAINEPRVLVFVTDPDEVVEPDAKILSQAYGLTEAEVEIASLLLQDKSVNEMSEWLGVTTHTIRFHIKQLFAKTGTNRQGSLVRLLSATTQIRRR